jgi:hypothetical protein
LFRYFSEHLGLRRICLLTTITVATARPNELSRPLLRNPLARAAYGESVAMEPIKKLFRDWHAICGCPVKRFLKLKMGFIHRSSNFVSALRAR